MSGVRLVLALHFHQPIGNFDSVFRMAVDRCYAPVVEHFERHPGVRAGFHVSGSLLEWLEAHEAPLLDRVLALVGKGQVEPLGGGFYEPILPAIPRADALDQIETMAAWWEKRAGVRPRGAWIAERVWEPSLAEILAEAGVAYTILDDQHLRFAGLLDDRFTGLFVTERAGRAVAFFPSDFALRYLIPFRPMPAVREHFAAADDGVVLTYGDDAEKFGLWPKTHEWVFGEAWLEQFFAYLEEPEGRVRAVRPQEIVDAHPVARKVYVPNASYTEMLEWALPAASVASYGRVRDAAVERAGSEAARAFVRGSLWDMFLARYPEADQLHKHVLWTSRRVRALPKSEPLRARALDAVLRAECNCAYWHGLFGGIYYSHLRHGLYHALLDGDAALQKTGRGGPLVEETDYDGDLEPELILRAGRLQAFFRPADAGTLVELDDLKSRFNVTNVLSRSREAYHEGSDRTHEGEGESGVASPHEQAVAIADHDRQALVYDAVPLRSLRDFTASTVPTPGALSRLEGMTLASGRPAAWRAASDGFRMSLDRPGFPFERRVRLDPEGRLEVSWDGSDLPREGVFGTLLALTLLTPDDPDRLRRIVRDGAPPIEGPPGEPFRTGDATGLVLEDRAFGFALEIGMDPGADVVAAPIETLQRSEVRYEKAYQGTLFALCWRFPQAGRRLTLTLRFRDHPVT